MKDSMSNNKATAPIVKQGHTAVSKFGTNPDVQMKGKETPRDLSVK